MLISQPGKPDMIIFNPENQNWYVADSKSKGGKKTDYQKQWEDEIGLDAVAFPETTEQLFDACRRVRIKHDKLQSIYHAHLSVMTFYEFGRYRTSVDADGLKKKVYTNTYAEAKAAHAVMMAKAINVRDFNESWED
jgi:hypothetical protein